MKPITDDMKEEMISYNSKDSIKYKVDYITTTIYPLNTSASNRSTLGGYMCWHMLSDYYPV
jgi:GH18 family chitinase